MKILSLLNGWTPTKAKYVAGGKQIFPRNPLCAEHYSGPWRHHGRQNLSLGSLDVLPERTTETGEGRQSTLPGGDSYSSDQIFNRSRIGFESTTQRRVISC